MLRQLIFMCAFAIVWQFHAFAEPKRGNIVVIGDSFVAGVGDPDLQGYADKLRKFVKPGNFYRLAVPGITSETMLKKLKRRLGERKQTRISREVRRATSVILDMGRNDFFYSVSPMTTKNNLLKIRRLIRARSGRSPATQQIYIALMPTTRRPSQQVWLDRLNRELIESIEEKKLIPLNAICPPSVIADGLHPTVAMYQAIANIMIKALRNEELPRTSCSHTIT